MCNAAAGFVWHCSKSCTGHLVQFQPLQALLPGTECCLALVVMDAQSMANRDRLLPFVATSLVICRASHDESVPADTLRDQIKLRTIPLQRGCRVPCSETTP